MDAAVFPREKLCGGGIVRQTDRLLAFLGVRIDVPSVRVHTIQFEYPGGRSTQHGERLFRVVRREDFDHALLEVARAQGVEILEGVRVTGLDRCDDGVRVQAGDRVRRARVVIGADGARSVVRRLLVGPVVSTRFVALETLTPIPGCASAAAVDGVARFDFRGGARGLRGYYWEFPSIRRGAPVMNRGLGGDRWSDAASLESRFAQHLRERDVVLDHADLQGATAPLYHPASPQSAERVLLAGDAVGIDPWFGEGISVAVGTGMLAAHAAAEALATRDFAFRDYRRRIAESATGAMLRRNRATARVFYRAARRPGALARWFGRSEAAAAPGAC
jgi:flavin-dependent dehydrogenase